MVDRSSLRKAFSLVVASFVVAVASYSSPALVLAKDAGVSVAGAKDAKYATGVVMGRPFTVSTALYEQGRRLRLRDAGTGVRNGYRGDVFAYAGIAIDFPTPQRFEGQTFVIEPSQKYMMVDGNPQPKAELKRYFAKQRFPEEWHNANPFSMHLKFFKIKNGMLPGYIEMKVQSTVEAPENTEVKGFFYAVPGTNI